MGLESAVETIIQFVLIATIVKFAMDNIIGVYDSEGHQDEIMLVLAVGICIVFDLELIESVAGEASAYAVGEWIDYIISGAAMSGGGAALLAKMKQNVAEVKAAA